MLRRSTWILIFLFLLVLAVFLVMQPDEAGDVQSLAQSPTPSYLLNFQDDEVRQLHVKSGATAIVILERDGTSAWILQEPEVGQADQARVDEAVRQVASLEVISEFSRAPDPAEVGLAVPAHQITVVLGDEEEYNLLVGDITPTGSGYYVQALGGAPVVVNLASVDLILDLTRRPPISPDDGFAPVSGGTPAP